MTHRRAPWLRILTALALALSLTACGTGDPEPTPTATIEVAGEFGVRPTITIPADFQVMETSTDVLIAGEGPELVDGQVVLLDYYAIDAVTEEVVADTYETLPEIRTLSEESLGAPLYELLLGQTVGSRLERVELGTPESPSPHVLVVDVRPTRATGEETSADPTLPTVTRAEDGAPSVVIPDASPPLSVRASALITGTGPQVATGESLVVQLVAVRWSDGALLDTTWGQAPRAVSLEDLGVGVSAGLVEQRVGSQVIVVVPPDKGNGVDTLVYVVDILATSDVVLPPTGTEGNLPNDPATEQGESSDPGTEPTAVDPSPDSSVNTDDLTGTESSPPAPDPTADPTEDETWPEPTPTEGPSDD